MICTVPDTLSNLLDQYRRRRAIKDSSAHQLEVAVAAFDRWHGCAVKLDVDEDTLCDFLTDQREVKLLEAKTVNGRRANLITLLRFARREKVRRRAPDPWKIKRYPEPERNPEAWTQEELARLLAACRAYVPGRPLPLWDGRHWRAVVLVMYYTAFRFSACLDLRREQLRPDGAIVADAEAQKTFCDEVGWLGTDAMAAIGDLPPAVGPALFAWPRKQGSFWYHWKRILGAAGLRAGRRDGPQRMRRTSATWMEVYRPGSATRHLGHKTAGLAKKHYIDRRIAAPLKASEILPPPLDPQGRLF